MSATRSKPTYSIGAVARLTGIRLESLRAWERRYRLVTPDRTEGNQRLYTQQDVTRLRLIKQLVDQGHAISTVASLTEPALRERLQLHADAPLQASPASATVKVRVYGDTLPFLVDRWRQDLCSIEVLGTHMEYSEFEHEAALRRDADVLVLELPAVPHETAARLSKLKADSSARRVVLIYSFGVQNELSRLRRNGVVVLRAPVTADELSAACGIDREGMLSLRAPLAASLADEEEIPPRRFDNRQLAALATCATGIRCECPHHLTDLIFRINAFETYSVECENRSEQDAALHAHLHGTAARARALLEEALDDLIRYEDLDLTPS